MRCALATFVFVALAAANPVAQGVTAAVTPSGGTPDGCSMNYSGKFKINPVNITSNAKRSIHERDSGDTADLDCTLHNGVLHDSEGRTGYIASNSQFQFDNPPQEGAIYTAGFSICPNGSLALGPDTTWSSCLSGRFYNLYDYNSGEQCHEVHLMAVGSGSAGTTASASVTTSTPSSAYGGASATMTGSASAIISTQCGQTTDGQPQCSTVTITPSATPECSEWKDGQAQCSTAAATAITAPAPAPTTTTSPCDQIGDAQVQCHSASAGVAVPSYTGPTIVPGAAADTFGTRKEMFGLAAGVLAVAML